MKEINLIYIHFYKWKMIKLIIERIKNILKEIFLKSKLFHF